MTLANKVQQFTQDADKVNAIVHGPASGAGSTVNTDGGPVRTFAKIDADMQGSGAVAQILAAKAAAEAARDAAVLNVPLKDTIALGLAAVADGQIFAVKRGGADGLKRETRFRRDTAATYTKLGEVLTGEDFDSITELSGVQGIAHAFLDAEGKLVAWIDSDGKLNCEPSEPTKNALLSVFAGFSDVLGFPYAFVDSEGKVLAWLDADGKFNFEPSASTRAAINYLVQDSGTDAFVIADAEGKVLFAINANGDIQAPGLKQGTQTEAVLSAQQIDAWPMPQGGAATLWSYSLTQAKLNLATTARGRRPAGGGAAPTIALTDTGFTHPKVIHVPGGWNGFEYWMAITPYFGLVGTDSQYENPHVFCSHDGKAWQEPFGITNPIDLPPDAPAGDYWSDTHLALGDDGYLYCFYRANGGTLGGRAYYSKRSRDGVTWSARKLVESSDALVSVDAANLMLSPAFLKNGQGWTCYDAIRTSPTGLVIPPQKNQTYTFVFRRSGSTVDASYGEYATDQIVNFENIPWGAAKDVWHLDAVKFGNLWFLLVCVGADNDAGGSDLYLAYSTDGWNFKVFTQALALDSYRSCLVPMGMADGIITLKMYRAKLDGTVDLHSLQVRIS